MSSMICNFKTGAIVKRYDTLQGARCAFTKMYRTDPTSVENLQACTTAYYVEFVAPIANELVTVKSLMNGKETQIRRVDVGTACDPSQERYWTM